MALKRLDRLPGGEPGVATRSGPANPGFEPETGAARGLEGPIVAGWEVVGESGSAEVDRDRPHSGRGSLRLDASGGPAAIVSEPFRPEGRSALTLRAWFRADRPDAKVRVRIDGQAAGLPYPRQLDVAVSGRMGREGGLASQIPEGGLDSARLRFELLGGRAGSGSTTSRSCRRRPGRVGAALRPPRPHRRALGLPRASLRRFRPAGRLALGQAGGGRQRPRPPAAVAGDRNGLIRTGEAPRPDAIPRQYR